MAADVIYKDKIDVFYGGLPDDIRIQQPQFGFPQHFDVFSNPKRLSPFRNMVADNGEDLTFNIVSFLYANSLTYGLGVVVGTGKAKVYYKNSDPITGNWAAASSGASSGGARGSVFFKEFHNYIYGASDGNARIWAYGDITSGPSFTETAYDLNGASVPLPSAQGIVTSDDLLLVPCGRYIVKKDGAGAGPTANWSVALTLPSNQQVVDICEFGDMALVATQPISGYGGTLASKVYLWDKVSPDISGTIDFGEGSIYVVDEVEGEVIGILNVGGNSAFGVKPRIVVRKWNGGTKANVYKEMIGENSVVIVYGNNVKAKDGNKLVFGAKVTMGGVTYNQLFAYGRKNEAYPFAVVPAQLVDNDVALTGAINGLGKLGDFYFLAHNSDGSVNRTNDQNAYGAGGTLVTSIYITQKINGGGKVQDSERRDKQFVMAGLICAPLTSGQSVALYYRINGTTSWSLIRLYSYGDDAVGMGFESGTDSSGDPLPNFREAQFKAISNAGAEVLSIPYAFKLVGAPVLSE